MELKQWIDLGVMVALFFFGGSMLWLSHRTNRTAQLIAEWFGAVAGLTEAMREGTRAQAEGWKSSIIGPRGHVMASALMDKDGLIALDGVDDMPPEARAAMRETLTHLLSRLKDKDN